MRIRPCSVSPHGRSTVGAVRAALLLEAGGVLLAAALATLAVTRWMARSSGVARVLDHAAALRTNYWTGGSETLTDPGYEVFLPPFQEVYVVDKRPVEYLMTGATLESLHQVPRLIVRARDGTSYWFNRIAIQYGVHPETLPLCIAQNGAGELRGELINGLARSVLRDEFGRYLPKDIVDPKNVQEATARAKERLAQTLRRYGLELYEISVSKPAFNEAYEKTIERKKVAEQEESALDQAAKLLTAGVESALKEIDMKKSIDLQRDRAQWNRDLGKLTETAQRMLDEQAKKLERLRSRHAIELAARRAEWQRELDAAAEAIARLRAEQAPELARKRAQAALALEAARAEWDARLSELARSEERGRDAHEGRLERRRQEKALELESLRAEWELELHEARRAARGAREAADGQYAERALSGQLERERAMAEAASLAERGREESLAFQARAEAFAEHGLFAVRAALVEKLASIAFEIAPAPGPGREEQPPPLRQAAARTENR